MELTDSFLRKKSAMRFAVLALLITVAARGSSAGDVPAEVIQRISGAERLSKIDSFVGSYTYTEGAYVAKPNGKIIEEEELVARVTRRADGSVDAHLVRFEYNGDDFTEQERAEIERELTEPEDESTEDESTNDEKDDTTIVVRIVIPRDEGDVGRFVFEPAELSGDTVVVGFRPTAEHRDDKGITEGTLAWNSSTLDPLWIEANVVKPEKPAKSTRLRLEYDRFGDVVFIARQESSGRGKVVFITRDVGQYESFTKVRPAAE
jgi:hypothetical protein